MADPIVFTIKPQLVITIDEEKILSRDRQDLVEFLRKFARAVQDGYKDTAQALALLSKYPNPNPLPVGTATPVGAITPRYLYEPYAAVVSGTLKAWLSTGTANTDWIQIG